jgi:hypothetical protein
MAVTTSQVQQLYIAYFNRPADFFGLTFQTAQANQFGLQFVADQFSKSPEYIATYAGMDTGDIVNTIYLNLFGRMAEPAGLKFWGDLLKDPKSGITVGNAAITIATGAINDDKVAVANKLVAANAFYASLDTNAEIVGYSGAAANQVLKTWMTGVTTQATLDASIAPAALTVVSANAAAAHDAVSNVGTTTALTVGIDAFAGTAGNDTINSVIDSALSGLDNINGGAGNDILNIASNVALTIPASAIVKNVETANLTAATTVGVALVVATAADISGWTGLTKANVTAGTTANVKAAATTDVVANAASHATVTGGNNVTASSATGNLVLDGAAGSVMASTDAGAITISAAGGAINANSATTVTVTGAKAAVTSIANGNVSIGGATAINSMVDNVSAQQQAADIAAKVTADAAVITTTAADGVAAAAVISTAATTASVTAMKTAILAATGQVTFDAAVDAGVAGTGILVGDGVILKAAFAAGLAITGSAAEKLAAAQSNAAGRVDAHVATAAAASATAVTTATDAAAALVAATDAAGDLADIVAAAALYTTTATTNTVLASASLAGGDVITLTDASTSSNKLMSVSLNATGNATLTGKALASVSIANNIADVTVVNTVAHAETLNLDNVTAGIITDANATSVTVNATTKSAGFTVSAAAATAVTLGGAGALSLTVTAANAAAATITGAGGVTLDLTGLKATAVVTATASTGANVVKVGATQSYLGGAGSDTVTLAAAPTKAVTGGAGAADEVVIGYAGAFDATVLTNVTGFETLGAGTGATGNLSATGFGMLHAGGGTLGGAVNFTNVAAGTALAVDGITGAIVSYALKDATGLTDAMTLSLGSATKIGFNVGSAIDLTGIEAVTVSSVSKSGTNTVSITDADALSLTVTGTSATIVTGLAGATVKTVNLSAATKLVDVSGITVDATGATFTAGVGGAKMTGGAGVDTFTGGAGVDTIHGGAGNDIIIGGGGKDIIWGDAGADKITLSGTGATLKFVAGDTGVNSSTTFQTAELTTTLDVVFGASAGTKIDLSFIAATANYNTDMVRASANLAGVDNKVVFASGTYDALAGTFTYAANGLDSVVTYDTDMAGTTAFQSVVLVGYHTSATTSLISGIVTL